jgi:hypothetical protein
MNVASALSFVGSLGRGGFPPTELIKASPSKANGFYFAPPSDYWGNWKIRLLLRSTIARRPLTVTAP